ncbi:hypothetical protein [Marinobacter confluentis]|uniref:Uncharacterized protein n=1 Tax=Marinobacter confluentis TaxID=1697557 RepID=A0A4Z1CJD4_9GAMM|nr:hypothetical protein [Marinobacter confluentis]TGN41622.1 hypothetical protein E5Q11_03580 [Marinobacter confluentis]
MTIEWMFAAVVAASAITVLLVLLGFWVFVIRPYLDARAKEIIAAAERIEPAVKRGVREGMEETLMELPETTLKESGRQVRRFGTGLFENGLSSLLGDAPNSSRKKSDS